MRCLRALILAIPVLLTACGSDAKGRPEAAAPINNIQDNVNTLHSTKQELKGIAKERNAAAEEAMKK